MEELGPSMEMGLSPQSVLDDAFWEAAMARTASTKDLSRLDRTVKADIKLDELPLGAILAKLPLSDR